MATGYMRVFNTTVSGQALVASLKGDDVRALEFAAALVQEPSLVLPDTTAVSVTVDQWVQAAIGSLGVDAADAGANVTTISLGADSPTGARLSGALCSEGSRR